MSPSLHVFFYFVFLLSASTKTFTFSKITYMAWKKLAINKEKAGSLGRFEIVLYFSQNKQELVAQHYI